MFNAKYFPAHEGSHLPLLMNVVNRTDGPILELGTGFFSTPVLHWMCNPKRRFLVSYESNPKFFEVAHNFEKRWHEVHLIEDWDKMTELPLDPNQKDFKIRDGSFNRWAVVFVDHAPGVRRNVEMARAAWAADFVVVHDTEAKSDWHYNYTKSFPLYKYRFDYIDAMPNTSVLSNFIDVSKIEWMK